MKRSPRRLDFFALGVLGTAALIVLARVDLALGLPSPIDASSFISTGLTLAALLLVPASIYIAALGAMFPNFDRATPVSLVGDWPRRIFRIVAMTLGYGLGAAALDAFGVPIGFLGVVGFIALLALGLMEAVWLLDASLLIIDPDRLGRMLADTVLRPTRIGRFGKPSEQDIEQAFNDIARLARELGDRRRPTAASHAIDRLTEMRVALGPALSRDALALADRVVRGLPVHQDIADAVARYEAER